VRGEYTYAHLKDFDVTLFPQAPLDAVDANVKTAFGRATVGLGLRF